MKTPSFQSQPAVKGVWLLFAALAVALAVAPLLMYPIFLMKLLCFALFALAFNLLLSYGGMLSFGHAAYLGLAAYVAADAAKHWGLTPELAILAGTGAAGTLGVVFGAIAIRMQGTSFTMITLALGQMVYFTCAQWRSFTGGDDGIQDVPRGRLLGILSLNNDITLYVFVSVVFLSMFALVVRITHSPFGQVMEAIRDNEARAVSLGYRVSRYKLALFTISTVLAGVAGSVKVIVFQVASLTDVHWSTSGEVVLMTLVGGMGSIIGPIVGAAFMVAVENYLAVFGGWITVLQGAIFVACVLAFREGIVGFLVGLPALRRVRRLIGSADNSRPS
jgi:branched-chain amino acid transport system permease protein